MSEESRWAIVTAPTQRRYFGRVRSERFDPVAGGAFVTMSPAYEYDLTLSEDKRELIRNVHPIDGMLEVEEVHTFATTIVYIAEGSKDVELVLQMVKRFEEQIRVQRSGLVLSGKGVS